MQDETPEDAIHKLREEVAELRQRILRLEASSGSGQAVANAVARTTPEAHGMQPTPVEMPAPSIESTIGSQWLGRVGVLAVLVGVALFLKLAIDNHWIGPAARIVLGLVGGIVVFAGSEPFRRKGYPGFAATLLGIGTGILYLSLWASFSLYHLLPVAAVGLGMVVVTAANGLLAWRQNSPAQAVYAIVGGMLTPFLLANAQHHEVALFAYLLLLSGGACVLAVARSWSGLVLSAFVGSAIYAIAWAFFWHQAGQFSVTVIFAAAGFLLFALIPFASWSGPTHRTGLTALMVADAIGGITLAIALYTGMASTLVVLGIAAFYYVLARLRRDLNGTGWITGLNANMALLVGVTLFIHCLWRGSAGARGAHTGEQLSYTFWFMGFGAVLVILGFWRRRNALRWQGLALLLASIAKVFVVDMEFLSAGFRVFSFLGLGVLLLVVSFVYQRDWLKLRKS